MHDGRRLAVRPPEFGLRGGVKGVEVTALLGCRGLSQEVLVEALGQGGGGPIAVQPEPAVLVYDDGALAVVVYRAALRDRTGGCEGRQPEFRVLEMVRMRLEDVAW